MFKEEDFQTAFGKRIFRENFGVFFPDDDEEEDEKEEVVVHANPQLRVAHAQSEPKDEDEDDEDDEDISGLFKEPAARQKTPQAPQKPVKPEVKVPDMFYESSDETGSAEQPSLEETVRKPVSLPASEPYEQGDNIFREILTFYLSNILCGKKVKPVLEEDGNCILETAVAAYRMSLMVEGRSRTGKSLGLDKLCLLLTSVYPLKSCSNKSLFGSAEKINENDFLYIAEYQAALNGNPDMKEAIKLLTEDKDATNDSKGDIQTVKGDITVITTGADENKKVQDMDVEVSGRFIKLRTSYSEEKTERIADYQDGLDTGTIPDVIFSEERYNRLKQHIRNIIDDKTSSFVDPFASRFYKQYLPNTQKSVYYRTLYKALVKAIAKLDRPNRIVKDSKIFTNIFDVYLVHELHHQTYCDNLRQLTEQSFQALKRNATEEEQARLDIEYQKEIREIDEKEKIVLGRDEWQDVWNAAYQHMKDNHPNLVNKWVKLQSTDGKVIVYDPVKKQDIYLCDVVDTRNMVNAGAAQSENEAAAPPAADGGN